MNEMAIRIKALREEKGWTQEELGSKVGLQKSAIAKYENGRTENMKRDVIKKMADAFGVQPSYLMGLDELNSQSVFDNPELKILFDAAKDLSAEDISMVVDIIERMKK